MAQIMISQLPPPPNGTGSGTPKGTDLTPATDTTDLTSAPTGTTKKYTRSAEFNYIMSALGYKTLAAVRVATPSALTATYSNGASGVGATLTNSSTQTALSIDSVTLAVGDRVLVFNQASSFQNGIYQVSNIGSASTNWVLTRTTDYDMPAEIAENDFVLVNQGATYTGVAFLETSPGPFTIGTSPITFARFSFNQSVFSWVTVTGTSQQMVPNTGYFANNAGLVTLTLPVTMAVGQEIVVSGQGSGGWTIAQNSGQQIILGNKLTTSGIGGSISSTAQYDNVTIVCMVAGTTFTVLNSMGNITYV